jgi:hypothetical protein
MTRSANAVGDDVTGQYEDAGLQRMFRMITGKN